MNHLGTICIVDDDPAIRKALQTTLSALGFQVGEADTGEAAIAKIRTFPADAVLLDINMSGIGGIRTCKELRQLSAGMGIVMLTVRDSMNDLEAAFDAGADDYITKPFHVRDLVARVRALIRRTRALTEKSTLPLTIGEIELDPDRRSVKKSGNPVRLTPKEFELLHHLMAHAGVPITHSKLLRAIWGPEYGSELEYLRTFMRQLRMKLEDDPSAPVYLLTDPFVGYRFAEEIPAGKTA